MHIVHCSIGRGYELAAAYRAQGHAATIEACIHYLTLDEENDVRRLGGKAKINPPLRSRREVEALWQHLAAGNVTIVSTDHVSWSEDRKTDPNMLKNASGVPGLEVLYPLLMKGLSERDLPLTHAARLLAHNPAALFRIAHVKGALAIGRDADIVLMRRDPYRYQAAASGNNFVSWSPYDGIELPFRVVATFLRGACVAGDGRVSGAPGAGKFVAPRCRPTEAGNDGACRAAARRRPPVGRHHGAGRHHRPRTALYTPIVQSAVPQGPRVACRARSRRRDLQSASMRPAI